jgi:hypothetical protein
MGFRDYSPGLNRFLTRDMFNGALADMSLGSNPWTMSRYTFAGGNPTTLVEHDGHMAIRDIDTGSGGGSGATCSDATPEYCYAPGSNAMSSYGLGTRWAIDEALGCPTPEKCVTVFHFRGGDLFTEAIRELESIQSARELIAADLANGETFGDANFHYSEMTPAERKQIAKDNAKSVLTFGMYGMPTAQAFIGSYDLRWNVVGYDRGSPIVEFHLTNASTLASASLDKGKVQEYPEGSAGDGHEAAPGEHWQQQSVRWREVFPGGDVPPAPLEPGFLLPGGTNVLDLCSFGSLCPERLPSLW